MAEKQFIKHLYEVEDKSYAEISRQTGYNYRTIKKYADKDDWNVEDLPNLEPQSYAVSRRYLRADPRRAGGLACDVDPITEKDVRRGRRCLPSN